MRTKRLWMIFLAAFCVLGMALGASAATLAVTTGNDSGLGSLRDAVSKAVAGDIVEVSPAVKSITLKSPVSVLVNIEIQGNGATISGGHLERLFNVGAETKFDSLTFTKGMAFDSNGGAVNIESAKADFVNCTFFDNRAGNDGGAVCVNSISLNATSFLNCSFGDNNATRGGGVAVLRGIASFSASVATGNSATAPVIGAADVYAGPQGAIFNGGAGYNVVGKTNARASFPVLQGNKLDVAADKVFQQPLKLEKADGVELLKLLVATSNPAFNLIPVGSALGLPAKDQRGVARPQMGATDAGAFEVAPVALAAVSVKGSFYLQVNKSEPYVIATTPTDATLNVRSYEGGVEWTVSDPTVLAVDTKGVVTALKPGYAALIAKAHGWDAAGNPIVKQGQIAIEVGTDPIPVPQVTIQSLNNLAMSVWTQQNVTPVVAVTVAGKPASLPYELSAFSSNMDVATANVMNDGKTVLITAKKVGTTQVTVSAKASNSTGASLTHEKTFVVTVSSSGGGGGGGGGTSGSSGGGGGGCSAGFVGLSLLLAAPLFLRKRK